MSESMREEYKALRDKMLASDAQGREQAAELFLSEDMDTLLTRMGEIKDLSMPSSNLDSVMGSAMSILNAIREVMQKDRAAKEAATKDAPEA